MKTLPVHEVIPEIKAALKDSNRLVLQAPPGAGKTTAVPLALTISIDPVSPITS